MSTNIKVCVRVRPENAREKSSAQRPVVAVMDESMLVFDPVYDESGLLRKISYYQHNSSYLASTNFQYNCLIICT